MKKDKDIYEEYVQPPSYNNSDCKNKDNNLISKLKFRIEKDLNHINGLFDSQVEESQKEMDTKIKEIRKMYTDNMNKINKNRQFEIGEYNSQAETSINSLEFSQINTIHTTTYLDWLLSFII